MKEAELSYYTVPEEIRQGLDQGGKSKNRRGGTELRFLEQACHCCWLGWLWSDPLICENGHQPPLPRACIKLMTAELVSSDSWVIERFQHLVIASCFCKPLLYTLLCAQHYQSPLSGVRFSLVPPKAKDYGSRTLVRDPSGFPGGASGKASTCNEFEKALGGGEGQGSLACCSPLLLQRVRYDWSDSTTITSILAWGIPRTEVPGQLQSTGSHGVRHDWTNLAHMDLSGFARGLWPCLLEFDVMASLV